jgi:hypothetical protein
MPIAPRSGLPGADIQLVTVKQNTEYKYDNQIGYARSGGVDYPLYLVNHGFNAAGGPPFSYALGGESLMPCSNYWDLFLPDGVQPNGTLELYLKYNRSSACIATINSSQYCDQTSDTTKYPLYWYDPATNATTWWDPMGKRPENLSSGDGQSVSCNTSSNEIHATIDKSNSRRPNLSSDFGYLPVMVGVPVLKNFTPLASNVTVTVTWTTNNETDINGFYVLRGQDSSNLNPITDLITHTGTALAGKSYSFTDSNRTNGVTYYYRLQIVRTDGTSIYSDIKSVAANVATKTPIITPSPTVTRTPILVTATRTPTRIPTQYPTRIPTKSPTPAFGIRATATFSIYPTLTYNPFTETPGIFDTLTAQAPTVEPSMTSETVTPSMEVVTGSPEATLLTRTVTPTVSGTPRLPSTSTASPDQNPWLSLVFGLLAGVGATGAVAGVWWYANPGRPKR